jgi:hypothetical protein
MLDSAALLVVFCATLFVYLHVFYHLKTCDDLEVLRIDTPTRDDLERACSLRQPVTFRYGPPGLSGWPRLSDLAKESAKGDLQIRNVGHVDSLSEYPIPLSLEATVELMSKDDESRFFTERNYAFMETNRFPEKLSAYDVLFRPSAVVGSEVDLMSGSHGANTPFRYHLCYRYFLCATEGEAMVRLCPPASSKSLKMINDYENMEFRSSENMWRSRESKKQPYADVVLREGEVLYVPPYWMYSVRYDRPSTLLRFSYRTLMSAVSVTPQSLLRLLQAQNTKHMVALVQPPAPPAYAPPPMLRDAQCENNQGSRKRRNKKVAPSR